MIPACYFKMRSAARLIVAVALFFSVTHASGATNYTWRVESSVSYLSGDYGTGEDTAMYYWPFTLKRFLNWGDVAVTVPYISVELSEGQTIIDGQVVQSGGTSSGTESGLGDIPVKARYYWIEQHGNWPYIDIVGRLKLPTANEDKGLGSGEADVGAGVELARRFAVQYVTLFDLSYTLIGDPSYVDYDNRWSASAGLGYQATPALLLTGSYDIRTAISPDEDDAHSVSFIVNDRVTPRVTTFAILDLGLTDGSEDYGVTGGASYRF